MANINLKDINLDYELFHDQTHSFKEFVINSIIKRKFVEKKNSHYRALKNFNLEVSEGEQLGVIGKNGAGKSTLLKVIAKILKPQEGVVKVDGLIQPLIEVGAGFNPELSGRDNIYLNAYMLGFKPDQVKEKEPSIIEFTNIDEFIDVPIKYYSTGMVLRLAFTIATMIEPEILIFDEVLATGDAVFMKKAQARINEMIDKAKILILVTHDFNLIRQFCKRVIVLEQGNLIFDGPTEEAISYYLEKYNV